MKNLQIIMLLFLNFLLFTSTLDANFDDGKKVFDAKCSACHIPYVPASKIKKNFFEMNNTLLHLKAPTGNMLAYTITRSPRHIGDPSDPDMQEVEIEEYLKDSLFNPQKDNSICDPHIAKYYDTKKSMKGKVTPKEIEDLAYYFMGYKKHMKGYHKHKRRQLSKKYNLDQLFVDAKRQNKPIIIEISSTTCYFCKKMQREVLDDEEMQSIMYKNYIFAKIEIDKTNLPAKLKKYFKGITPTFLFFDDNGTLIGNFPGSWNMKDWKMIIKEVLKRIKEQK